MVALFARVPSSFMPVEDQGYIFSAVIMPDAASLDRTEAVTERAAEWFRQAPRGEGRGHRAAATA